MRFNQWIIILAAGLGVASNSFAVPEGETEQLQITQCLAAQLPANYPILAENKAYQIIAVPTADVEKIIHLADSSHCGRFINVSHRIKEGSLPARKAAAKQLLSVSAKKTSALAKPYEIHHQSEVFEAINEVKVESILATLTHLTQYENRSATKQTGVDTAAWLKSSFEQMAAKSHRDDTATYLVKTGRFYRQPSLVTVIGKESNEPAIVIGAHMDTLDGRMPGAGDDGSGSASIMEMARVLLDSPLRLKRPIYLIWYAAEERGLVGSQFVVADFIKKSIPVKAVIQFDMTGFRNDREDSTMWVYQDYTDKRLNDFVAKLMETYLGVLVGKSRCGYGCSDHASWTAEGIPAAFPCETNFKDHNTKIHTSEDTIDRLTPEHMVNFTKLGLAFAIELASD